jgi:hypothetical protein
MRFKYCHAQETSFFSKILQTVSGAISRDGVVWGLNLLGLEDENELKYNESQNTTKFIS